MTGDVKRLLRLARAQMDLAKMLELKLAQEQRQLLALAQTRVETMAAIERVSTAGLIFYAAAMRRLTELDGDIAAKKQRALDSAGRLLRARNRQDILLERAAVLETIRHRRSLEEETREIALAMCGKAAGKKHMLK